MKTHIMLAALLLIIASSLVQAKNTGPIIPEVETREGTTDTSVSTEVPTGGKKYVNDGELEFNRTFAPDSNANYIQVQVNSLGMSVMSNEILPLITSDVMDPFKSEEDDAGNYTLLLGDDKNKNLVLLRNAKLLFPFIKDHFDISFRPEGGLSFSYNNSLTSFETELETVEVPSIGNRHFKINTSGFEFDFFANFKVTSRNQKRLILDPAGENNSKMQWTNISVEIEDRNFWQFLADSLKGIFINIANIISPNINCTSVESCANDMLAKILNDDSDENILAGIIENMMTGSFGLEKRVDLAAIYPESSLMLNAELAGIDTLAQKSFTTYWEVTTKLASARQPWCTTSLAFERHPHDLEFTPSDKALDIQLPFNTIGKIITDIAQTGVFCVRGTASVSTGSSLPVNATITTDYQVIPSGKLSMELANSQQLELGIPVQLSASGISEQATITYTYNFSMLDATTLGLALDSQKINLSSSSTLSSAIESAINNHFASTIQQGTSVIPLPAKFSMDASFGCIISDSMHIDKNAVILSMQIYGKEHDKCKTPVTMHHFDPSGPLIPVETKEVELPKPEIMDNFRK